MLAVAFARRAMEPLAAASLGPWLRQRLGLELAAIEPVGGGSIHRSWRLRQADGSSCFAKSNRADQRPLLEAEWAGLEALAAWAEPPLQLPQPLALGEVAGSVVLVLSWLELGAGGQDAERGWRQLGASLARLHRASAGAHAGRGFGFDADNFIGSAPQRNRWCADWPRFFRQERLEPQLHWAAHSGQRLRGAEALLEQLPDRLGGHGCQPVLVHGDLWSGNAALLAGGGGAIFDPACYWADREVDLAMARLFGGFPAAFFTGYEQVWPLPAGAAARVPLYNLYHLLNHANLFGGGYWRQAQASLNALLADPG
jgi:fructosamine-3-kinase